MMSKGISSLASLVIFTLALILFAAAKSSDTIQDRPRESVKSVAIL
jgi:hypothetical protein